MIIQAELKCKQTGCEADPCAVDKVIELPSLRFQQFSRALLADDDAIYELDGYMDFEKYGQDCMENDCVTKTEFGLLRRLDPPFPEQRQGQRMM